MKRYLRAAIVIIALAMAASGCGKGKNNNPAQNYEDISAQLTNLADDIAALEEKAEQLHSAGKLDDDKYNTVMGLKARLAEIGSEGTKENKLKYNELKKIADELKYSLSALDNPQAADEEAALNSLIVCIEEVEPVIKSANEKGSLPDDRLALFNEYKAEVQGYINGTREKGEGLTERLAEIRSDITTIASQAEADNETIDKLLAQPVTVEDNTKLEELISNYIDLQNEVSEKVANNELEESKLNELMTIGVKVAAVKEALHSGNVTDETRQTMTECNKELKEYAEGIGSDSAQYFE